ncbi:unnamed protein product [Schistosoma mattheei]|uniref:Uncharacterized protein n=1 Tax=Schistosoma mattheei TaxID=31246 RepID=A0A3P8GQM0_9TREM|nr:unnamed protein product [Schistosoma mattheei]
MTANVNAKIKDVDIMICMLCLGDNTDPRDELIECDGCGIVVHEAHSAQKHGLLSEPTVEESSADPFFAHCRQHTDKTVARHRRRNFLTTMLRLKKWRSNRQLDLHCLDEKKPNISCLRTATTVDPRIQRKLEHYHKLYKDVLRNREKPYGMCLNYLLSFVSIC